MNWCNEAAVLWNWISPFSSHYQNCVLMELGSDEGIHLCHITAEPAKSEWNLLIFSGWHFSSELSRRCLIIDFFPWIFFSPKKSTFPWNCKFPIQIENTHNNQHVAPVRIKTHWTILKSRKFYESRKERKFSALTLCLVLLELQTAIQCQPLRTMRWTR